MALPPPGPGSPPVDKSVAACTYMDNLTKLTTDFKTAVSCPATAAGTPLPPALPVVDPKVTSDALRTKIQDMLEKIKTDNNSHPETTTIDAFKVDQATSTPFDVSIKSAAGSNAMSDSTTLDDIKGIILADLTDKKTPLKGGRRGKRSARRGRGRKSRKGGRRSRGCKGRRSRGRTNKRR